MGPAHRAGAYTYDWIENPLGLDMPPVQITLPEFQHPKLGDTIGFGSNHMRIERIEPERVLAWRSEDSNLLWSFILTEDSGVTRLVSHNRLTLPAPVANYRVRRGRQATRGEAHLAMSERF